MSNQPFMEYLKSLQNSNKEKRVRDLKIAVGVIALLIALILVWGFFYARNEVPWPEERIPVFEKEAFHNAHEDYGKAEGILLVDKKKQHAIVLDYLNNQTSWQMEGLARFFEAELNDKTCLVEALDKMGISPETKELIDKKKNDYQQLIEKNEELLENTPYWEAYQVRREIQNDRSILSSLKEFESGLSQAFVKPEISYPYSESVLNPKFVVGKITGVSFSRDSQLRFQIEMPRPVLQTSFLQKQGISGGESFKTRLKQDDKVLRGIYSSAEKKFSEHKSSVVKEINAQISPARSMIRERFYTKWFSILLMTVVSLIMFLFLKWYYIVIRRKGIARKETHEIYLATNVTSWLLRILALIVIVLGVIALTANLYLAIKNNTLCTRVGLFSGINYIYGLFSPLWITLMTFMGSWLLVLQSEFLCFVSNVYHVMFVKAHKKD